MCCVHIIFVTNIIVTRSAPEVNIEPRGPIEVPPGSPMNLTCSVTGFPAPNITWMKDGAPMEMASSESLRRRVIIKELFKSSVFTCVASNDMGHDEDRVEVVVTGEQFLKQINIKV